MRSKERWLAVAEIVAEIAGYPIFVDGRGCCVSTNCWQPTSYIRRHHVRLILVDYIRLLQLLGVIGNVLAGSRIALISKVGNVAVVMLSQLKRPEVDNAAFNVGFEGAGRHRKSPSHRDFALAANRRQGCDHASVVRPCDRENRNGSVGEIPVYFDERTPNFMTGRNSDGLRKQSKH
jgi:replicative DNA helicase